MSIPPSETARQILAAAATHAGRLAVAPTRLPAAAANAVARVLLREGWVEHVEPVAGSAWSPGPGAATGLRVTAAGMEAIGMPTAPALTPADACSADPVAARPMGSRSGRRPHCLREAALAVLAAWDDARAGHPDLAVAIGDLRLAVTSPKHRVTQPASGSDRRPRTDTKQAAVLALLRRPGGVSGPQIIEATGWAPHTVRGFLAGLSRKGVAVRVLERVRRPGPKRDTSNGSYTLYHVATWRPEGAD
jgi:Protein of unknown function (DUF3489)